MTAIAASLHVCSSHSASFGAPTKRDALAFNLGGSIFAWEAVGFGARPSTPAPNQIDTPILHVPALVEGRQPNWSTTGGSLFINYGSSVVSATVNAVFNATGKERQGFYNATNGPSMGQAFLTINPAPIGQLQLQVRVGGFTESFVTPARSSACTPIAPTAAAVTITVATRGSRSWSCRTIVR